MKIDIDEVRETDGWVHRCRYRDTCIDLQTDVNMEIDIDIDIEIDGYRCRQT